MSRANSWIRGEPKRIDVLPCDSGSRSRPSEIPNSASSAADKDREAVHLITLITIGSLLCAVVSFVIAFERQSVQDEILKVTYEFFLVGVIGGLLSFQFKLRQQAAADREAKRILQRGMLTKLIKAYGGGKKVRRLLRATAILGLGTENALVLKEPYERQMERLMDVQLEFEALNHQAENSPDLFSKALADDLEKMEKYLNKVLKDYEESPNKFKDTKPLLTELKHVEEFVAMLKGKTEQEKKETAFYSQFAEPFKKGVAELQRLIIART